MNPDDALYAWDVELDDGGVSGVTSDRGKAIGHVDDALRDAPTGTSGVVRRVAVGQSGWVAYVTLGTVATAMRDEASGAIVWTGP